MAGPSGYLDVDMVVTQRGDRLETRVLDSPSGETGTLSASLPSTLDGDDKDVGNALFLLRALRRTQRLMDARHYLAEYDLSPGPDAFARSNPAEAT